MIIFRTELKYYLCLKNYVEFRKALEPFMQKDPFTKKNERSYDVHSIYYDTYSLENYYQKVDGEDEREKFRIRFYNYNEEVQANVDLFLELKQKRGPIIKKLRYKTNTKNLKEEIGSLDFDSNQMKVSILQNFHLKKMEPVIKISYKREALVCRFDSDLRITFDGSITGAYSPSFSVKKANNEKMLLNPLYYILEIKTADSLPIWLNHLIKRFSLDLSSFSKYGKGIENCSIVERQKGM